MKFCRHIWNFLSVALAVFSPASLMAQPTGSTLYVADGWQRSGSVYEAAASLEPRFINPDGRVHSIAFRDTDIFFVNANRNFIYRTGGCSAEVIYTHKTFVRDIAFDSTGTLHFSEASGGAGDGKIFTLDVESGDVSTVVTVSLDDVGGFWAGNFAFDPNDTLYLSSGNRRPAMLMRHDPSGFIQVYRSEDPIMGFVFTDSDTLFFADHAQDIRQLDNFTTETRAYHAPNATWLTDVGFAGGLTFRQDPDIDGDGQGDWCDCDDGFMGAQENGADCGGSCGGTCPSCVPVLVTGGNAQNVDVVFVPDNDYAGNFARFRNDVRNLIMGSFMKEATLKANACQFNFYLFETQGDYVGPCQTYSVPSNLYTTGNCPKDQTAIVFTGNDRACASGIGSGLFSVGAAQASVMIHESGHATFELFDEYCSNGSCDGNYNEATGRQSNVYHSAASCKANSTTPNSCWNFCPETVCSDTTTNLANWGTTLADCQKWANDVGVDASKCVQEPTRVCAPNWRAKYSGPKTCDPTWTNLATCQTWATAHGLGTNRCEPHATLANRFCYDDIQPACVDGGDGWWKADRTAAPNFCTMAGGSVFEPDCAARVAELLAPGGVCDGLVNTASSGAPAPAPPLAVLLELTYDGVDFDVDRMEIVRNYPPRFFPQEARFRLALKETEGEVAFEMTLGDPRIRHVFATETEGPMKRLIEPASTTLLLPFDPGVLLLTIVDQERDAEVLSSDLGGAFAGYCSAFPDDQACPPD